MILTDDRFTDVVVDKPKDKPKELVSLGRLLFDDFDVEDKDCPLHGVMVDIEPGSDVHQLLRMAANRVGSNNVIALSFNELGWDGDRYYSFYCAADELSKTSCQFKMEGFDTQTDLFWNATASFQGSTATIRFDPLWKMSESCQEIKTRIESRALNGLIDKNVPADKGLDF